MLGYKLQMFGSQLDNGHRLDQAPSQSRLLLHRQGGVKVSDTENKVKFSTEESLHRTQALCRFDTFFPCGTRRKSSLKDHFLSVAFSKVCYIWSTCSYIHCTCIVSALCFLNIIQSKPQVLVSKSWHSHACVTSVCLYPIIHEGGNWKIMFMPMFSNNFH